MKEKRLEDKLRELSLDELNKITIRKIAATEANTGRVQSDETKAKISEALKGRVFSDEAKAKMSEAKKNISDETKAKLSEALKGRVLGDEHKANISEALRKTTDAQILEIKSKYATGKYSKVELAREYGVTATSIRNYIKKR